MKKFCLLAVSAALTLMAQSCGNVPSDQTAEELSIARDSMQKLIAQIDRLNAEVAKLRYPADQRLANIKRLIDDSEFSNARNEIAELKVCFPSSEEASQCDELLQTMTEIEQKQKAEQDRIRALGFKALKPSLAETVDCNKLSFSALSFSNTFTFDAYDDRYFYRTADRGNIYALATMSVTSSDKNPNIPTLAIYSVEGSKLTKEGVYGIEFARWRDYGAYLGNYHDNNNDFAKVSTIKFKLGCEVPVAVKTSPYIIVLLKENTQSRHYDRFENPPYRYSGPDGYPTSLSIDDFNTGRFVAVKIGNL